MLRLATIFGTLVGAQSYTLEQDVVNKYDTDFSVTNGTTLVLKRQNKDALYFVNL